jgi:hypothetical protein
VVILLLTEYYEKFLKGLKMYKMNSEVAKDQTHLAGVSQLNVFEESLKVLFFKSHHK